VLVDHQPRRARRPRHADPSGVGNFLLIEHDRFEDHNATRSPFFPTLDELAVSLILLVLPLLSTAARMVYHNHNHNLYIKLVSAFLNDQLRPLITDRLSEPGLLGWHERSAEYQRGPRWHRLAHPAGLGLTFPVPAAVALVLVVSCSHLGG
jgi:hypothetical protein